MKIRQGDKFALAPDGQLVRVISRRAAGRPARVRLVHLTGGGLGAVGAKSTIRLDVLKQRVRARLANPYGLSLPADTLVIYDHVTRIWAEKGVNAVNPALAGKPFVHDFPDRPALIGLPAGAVVRTPRRGMLRLQNPALLIVGPRAGWTRSEIYKK